MFYGFFSSGFLIHIRHSHFAHKLAKGLLSFISADIAKTSIYNKAGTKVLLEQTLMAPLTISLFLAYMTVLKIPIIKLKSILTWKTQHICPNRLQKENSLDLKSKSLKKK